MHVMLPTPTLSQLLFSVLFGGAAYLLGVVIAHGLTRLTRFITARRSSPRSSGIDDRPNTERKR